jgi:hypothetical protein
MICDARVFAIVVSLALWAAGPLPANENDQIAARSAALELAGAWSNDGFKLRDGHVTGELKPGESRLVQVSLYAGNQYWLTVATAKGGKIAVTLYDEAGKPVATEPFEDGSRAAAGFSPSASGPYWVKITASAEAAVSFAFVYSYK